MTDQDIIHHCKECPNNFNCVFYYTDNINMMLECINQDPEPSNTK